MGLRSNVADYFYHADAFCLSSEFEGLPITLLESMAMSCIPICTPVGGIPDVIDNITNGILSKDSSEIELYNAINLFLNMEEFEKINIQKNILKDFKDNYDINICSSKYYSLYCNQF
jgi:glycosyltransferase involved in cell wall biosynthesis